MDPTSAPPVPPRSSTDVPLPDSTTTFLNKDNDVVNITVDTAIDSFPDLFLNTQTLLNVNETAVPTTESNPQTNLNVSNVFTPSENTTSMPVTLLPRLGPETTDLKALDDKSRRLSDSELVSSTSHGFPEQKNRFQPIQGPEVLIPVLNNINVPVEKTNLMYNASTQQHSVTTEVPQQDMLVLNAASSQPLTLNPVGSDVYTLTLTDGSVVQLRVQADANQQVQQQTQLTSVQPDHSTNILDTQFLLNDSASWNMSTAGSHLPTLQKELRATSSSPASVAAEVTLPFSNPTTPTGTTNTEATLSLPSSPADLLEHDDIMLSPVASPHEVQPNPNHPPQSHNSQSNHKGSSQAPLDPFKVYSNHSKVRKQSKQNIKPWTLRSSKEKKASILKLHNLTFQSFFSLITSPSRTCQSCLPHDCRKVH